MTDGFRTSSSSWRRRIDVVRRRRTLFIATSVAAFLVGAAFVVGLPHLYRAKATLLVQGAGSAELLQTDDHGVNGRFQTIKQEALSRARLIQLIRKYGLYGVGPNGDVDEATIARMQRDVRVDVTSTDQSPNGPTTVAFTVSYVSSDPQTAAAVTNALAAFYVAQNDEMRAARASVATSLLGAQLNEARGKLDSQEARIRGYVASNNGALPQQVDANLAALSRLDAQVRLNDGEYARLVERRQLLQNQLAETEVRGPAADATDVRSRLALARKELADLRQRLSDDYPDVRAKAAEVKQLEREAAAPAARPTDVGPSPKDTTMQALKETEAQIGKITAENDALRREISGYQQRVDQGASHEPMLNTLMRDYQSTRDLYDATQKRFNDAQLNERAEQGPNTQEFKILDAAVPPSQPTGPQAALLIALSAAIALILGVAVLAIAERVDTSFHSIDELRTFTTVPVLASIPVLKSRRPLGGSMRVAALASAATVVIAAAAAGAFHVAHGCEQVVRLLSRVG